MSIEEQKQKFIGAYLDKHMSHEGLPKGMSIEYYSRLNACEEKAEKAWDRKQKKLNSITQNTTT